MLVEQLKGENLLNIEAKRTHSPSLLSITANPLAGINGKSLKDWITQRMEMCRVRHYYQQFITVSPSYVEEEISVLYPNLVLSWSDRPI